MVATVGIVFMRHDGEIQSIKTDRLLRHPAHPCNTLAVAEGAQFRSREPQALPVAPTKREPRRYRTGRNQQLNLKVTAEAAEAFYALADEKGWVLGEVFERAIIALKRDLEGQGKGDD
jgi:hypothetical protein